MYGDDGSRTPSPSLDKKAPHIPGIAIDDVAWMRLGDVEIDNGGNLRFPKVSNRPGIYRFMFIKDGKPLEGYVGQSGQRKGLHGRFRNYRLRGRTPLKPPGTTSNLAAHLLRALRDGQTVTVEIVVARGGSGEGNVPLDLGDEDARLSLEHELIVQLRSLGVKVLNRTGP